MYNLIAYKSRNKGAITSTFVSSLIIRSKRILHFSLLLLAIKSKSFSAEVESLLGEGRTTVVSCHFSPYAFLMKSYRLNVGIVAIIEKKLTNEFIDSIDLDLTGLNTSVRKEMKKQ